MFPIYSGDDFKDVDFSTVMKGPKHLPKKVSIVLPKDLLNQIEDLPEMEEYPGLSGKCRYLIEKALENIDC